MKTKILTSLCLLSIVLIGSGCSSSQAGFRVTGPDASHIYGAANRMCAELGVDPNKVLKGVTVRQNFSPVTGKGRDGDFTCDPQGCWLGITRKQGTKTFQMEWPQSRPFWVIPHEFLHVLHWVLKNQHGRELTPGHWEFTRRADGSLVLNTQLIRGRWPAANQAWETFKALPPGGRRVTTPWKIDPWDTMCDGPEWLFIDNTKN